MTAWRLEEAYVGTHLFFAKAKTPTHVAYEAAIALLPFLGIVLTVRQVVVSARHGGAGTEAGRVSVKREIGTIVLLGATRADGAGGRGGRTSPASQA